MTKNNSVITEVSEDATKLRISLSDDVTATFPIPPFSKMASFSPLFSAFGNSCDRDGISRIDVAECGMQVLKDLQEEVPTLKKRIDNFISYFSRVTIVETSDSPASGYMLDQEHKIGEENVFRIWSRLLFFILIRSKAQSLKECQNILEIKIPMADSSEAKSLGEMFGLSFLP